MSGKYLSRRQFLILSAASATGAMLAACAPAATPEPEVEPEEAEPEEEVEEEEAEPEEMPAEDSFAGRTYTIWGLQYDKHIETYEKVAAAFEVKTGAVGTVEAMDWPIEAKVITAMAAGTVPDVVCLMGYVTQPVVDQGGFVAMDDTVFEPLGVAPEDIFSPGAIGAYYYKGQHWGIPTEQGWVDIPIVARTDWIEEAGDEALALWPAAQGKDKFDSYEQLYELAKILQDSRGDPQITGISSSGHDTGTWWTIMNDLGQFWWDEETGEFFLDSPEAHEAMDIFINKPVFDLGIEVPQEHRSTAFMEQKVAITRWNTVWEAEEQGIPAEGVVAPSAVDGEWLNIVGEGGWGYSVPTGAENMDIAIEFQKFMCTLEPQYIWSSMYGINVPAHLEVMNSDIFEGDDALHRSWQRWVKALPYTRYMGNGYGNGTVVRIDTVEATCGLVRAGDLTIDEACSQMQEKVVAHYEETQAALNA